MAQLNLRRVRQISQKEKDTVYGYIKIIQTMFSTDDNPYYTIDQLIQDLILLYFHALIDTKILTRKEQNKLLQMVENHLDDKYSGNEWKLLYRGSRDGFGREKFHQKCDLKENTICIIQTPKNYVFGGFTRLKWDESEKRETYPSDSSAFLYLIRSNKDDDIKIFPVLNDGDKAIGYHVTCYLMFGYGCTAFLCNPDGQVSTYPNSKSYDLGQETLNGSHRIESFMPTEMEVYQLINS